MYDLSIYTTILIYVYMHVCMRTRAFNKCICTNIHIHKYKYAFKKRICTLSLKYHKIDYFALVTFTIIPEQS